MHSHGFFKVWTPYPPVFPALLYLATAVSGTYSGFLIFWRVLNVGLVLATAYLIYRLHGPAHQPRALAAAAGFVLLNATYSSRVTIGYYIDQFEYIPVFLTMLSLGFLRSGRVLSSALAAGVGAMTKIFPGVMLLVAPFHLRGRARLVFAGVFLLTCLAILVPFLLGGREQLVSWYQFTASRDGWETVWTYPDIKFPPIPGPRAFTQPFSNDARPFGWLTLITLGAMAAYLLLQRLFRATPRPARMALCLILLMLIFAKGVSSYFMFWVFPLLFVLYRPVSAFLITMLLMLVANIEFFRDTFWISIWVRHGIFAALLVHQSIAGLRERGERLGETNPGVGEEALSDGAA
jgi:hypothetical protein